GGRARRGDGVRIDRLGQAREEPAGVDAAQPEGGRTVGEGTTRVEEKPPRRIEREIEHLRTRLDRSLAELDRRRHELADIKLQVRKHPRVVIGAGAVVAALLGGVVFAIWRTKREELPQKMRRIQIAFGRAIDK